MKKMLSLLGVLTLSGSAGPTVIAASNYENLGFIINNNFNFFIKNNSSFWSNTTNSGYKDVKLFDFSNYAKDFEDFVYKYKSLSLWGYKELFDTYVYNVSPYTYKIFNEWKSLSFSTIEMKNNLNQKISHRYCEDSSWPIKSKFNSSYYFYIINTTELWMKYSAGLERYFGTIKIREDTISMSFKGFIVK